MFFFFVFVLKVCIYFHWIVLINKIILFLLNLQSLTIAQGTKFAGTRFATLVQHLQNISTQVRPKIQQEIWIKTRETNILWGRYSKIVSSWYIWKITFWLFFNNQIFRKQLQKISSRMSRIGQLFFIASSNQSDTRVSGYLWPNKGRRSK